jgi:hypothetical protein
MVSRPLDSSFDGRRFPVLVKSRASTTLAPRRVPRSSPVCAKVVQHINSSVENVERNVAFCCSLMVRLLGFLFFRKLNKAHAIHLI